MRVREVSPGHVGDVDKNVPLKNVRNSSGITMHIDKLLRGAVYNVSVARRQSRQWSPEVTITVRKYRNRSCIGNTFLYQNAISKVGVLPIHKTVFFFSLSSG